MEVPFNFSCPWPQGHRNSQHRTWDRSFDRLRSWTSPLPPLADSRHGLCRVTSCLGLLFDIDSFFLVNVRSRPSAPSCRISVLQLHVDFCRYSWVILTKHPCRLRIFEYSWYRYHSKHASPPPNKVGRLGSVVEFTFASGRLLNMLTLCADGFARAISEIVLCSPLKHFSLTTLPSPERCWTVSYDLEHVIFW